MAPLLYLITPANADPAAFSRLLMQVLTGPEIAALLVRRGTLGDAAYAELAERMIQIGQAAGAAVLLENDVMLARGLGADGVHVSQGGVQAIREAVAALKPGAIVGAGAIKSRHDAMSFGELDVDYVLFGTLDGKADPQAAELAQWWADTFEVPAVHALPDADAAALAATSAEFVALSDSIWNSNDPAAALLAIDRAAREPA